MENIYIKICALLLIAIGVLVGYIGYIHHQIRHLKNQLLLAQEEQREWRDKLLEKIKERIVITQQSEINLNSANDLVSQFIYKDEDVKRLGIELQKIFHQSVNEMLSEHPSLTDLDILVIILLGIGMDNLEIYTLLRMEKRTLYKRRQLIAQRIGISSLQLDEWAVENVNQ